MTTTPKPQPKAPPAPTKKDWSSITDHLRDNPGQWHLIGDDIAVGVVSYLKRRYGPSIRYRLVGVKDGRAAELYAIAEAQDQAQDQV